MSKWQKEVFIMPAVLQSESELIHYKQCGLSEDYHLHTLRHFYATYLLQEGTSKQVAASLLGHADTAFLERTYCHPQDVAKRQAANLMQDLLNNQNPCYVAFMKNKNRKVKKVG